MINALRITLGTDLPYENVTIYSEYMDGHTPAPSLFEDSQLMFKCKHGEFVVPDYNVTIIHLNKKRITPTNSIRVKRIVLWGDITFEDCHIIPPKFYSDYDITQIFRGYEQMAFSCKNGLFITTDFQIKTIQLR